MVRIQGHLSGATTLTGEIDKFTKEMDREQAEDDRQRQERVAAANPDNITLYDSALGLGDLYVELKNKGVDKEYILDIIRLPMMFASMPEQPEKVTAALADIDKVDRSN